MARSYTEKLKDPRWQKKRLEILERDNFTCQICYDDKDTLHVHHRYYVYGNDPWDYPSDSLTTLCTLCHKEEGEEMKEAIDILLKALKMRFFSSDIHDIACAIHFMKSNHSPEDISAALSFTIRKEKELDKLVKKFLNTLSRKNKCTV